MWHDPQHFKRDYHCPKCESELEYFTSTISCSKCGRAQEAIRCSKQTCKFLYTWKCCESQGLRPEGPKSQVKSTSVSDESTSALYYVSFVVGVFMVLVSLFMFFRGGSRSLEDLNKDLIENLRKDFPSQKNETWFHFLSVLEKEIPSVKSIILLHGKDKRTPDCLSEKLVSLFTGNKSIKSKEITFSAEGYEAMDYGFALEHYRVIVETFRVFITDLTEVTGNTARIFHSLCDEVSSDIKPSLFIFTLKFDEKTEKLKPMSRAITILREAWSDLPENEIHPLLSRIIKNVVDVVPEKNASC